MTQKCCSQGACPTARDPAQKKKQNPKAPNHWIFQIWGLAGPLGPGSLSTAIPRKQTQKEKKEGEGTRFLKLFPCTVRRVEAKSGPTLRMKKRA